MEELDGNWKNGRCQWRILDFPLFSWYRGIIPTLFENSPIVFQTFSFISPEKAHANEAVASFLCHHLHPNRLCYYFKWLSLGHILKGLITYAYAYLQHGLYLYSQITISKYLFDYFRHTSFFFLAWLLFTCLPMSCLLRFTSHLIFLHKESQ